ncbi:hypothetical protein [Streptomyces sp. NBC_01716]|uniref:hypothetical protein n=1 Tax=Streptomyces sp. NBC_01716 TaxID=2975917 RepID=UPI002E328F5E|nr:hypothetical protein [Streptomyces sp. NBC_01716]
MSRHLFAVPSESDIAEAEGAVRAQAVTNYLAAKRSGNPSALAESLSVALALDVMDEIRGLTYPAAA